MSFPQRGTTVRYLDRVVVPALDQVAQEMRDTGVEVTVTSHEVEGLGVPSPLLRVALGEQEDFLYQVYPVAHATPSFAYHSAATEDDDYYRLEVFTANGSRGYDVYGYSAEHLIVDVLDLYESHLEYLRVSAGVSTQTMPVAVTTDWQDDFPAGMTGELAVVDAALDPEPAEDSPHRPGTS